MIDLIFALLCAVIYVGVPWAYLRFLKAFARSTDIFYRPLHSRTGWWSSFAAVAGFWGYGFTEWAIRALN